MKRILFLILLTISIIAGADDYNADKDDIWSMAYSQDGKYIAVAEFGGLIRIYESDTLNIVKTLDNSERLLAVSQIVFSPDGLYIAICSNEILIFEIETGNILFRLIPKRNYSSDITTSISYRIDGQRLVSGTRSGLITIWDTVNGVEIMTLQNPGWVTRISYSPDGNKIISASGRDIKIWDANNGTELKTLPEQNALVISPFAAYNSDGTKILVSYQRIGERPVIGGRPITIEIYDSDNYDVLYSYIIGDGMAGPSDVFFIFNTNYIALNIEWLEIIIIDYTNGNTLNTLNMNTRSAIVVSPNGKNILYKINEKEIGIWEIK